MSGAEIGRAMPSPGPSGGPARTGLRLRYRGSGGFSDQTLDGSTQGRELRIGGWNRHPQEDRGIISPAGGGSIRRSSPLLSPVREHKERVASGGIGYIFSRVATVPSLIVASARRGAGTTLARRPMRDPGTAPARTPACRPGSRGPTASAVSPEMDTPGCPRWMNRRRRNDRHRLIAPIRGPLRGPLDRFFVEPGFDEH